MRSSSIAAKAELTSDSVSVREPSLKEEMLILNKYSAPYYHDLKALEKERGESPVFILEYGGKSLLLFFRKKAAFGTLIFTNGQTKIPGETTALYRRAKELMRQQADNMKKPLPYMLSTESPAMMGWARTEGEKLFGWRGIENITPHRWNFETMIQPEVAALEPVSHARARMDRSLRAES